MTSVMQGDQAHLAAANLELSELESRLIVDSIPAFVATLKPTGDVEFINRPLLEYSRKTMEELRKWGTSDLVHPEDLPRAIESFTNGIRTGEPFHIVHRMRRFDGVYRWFQGRHSPQKDLEGRIVRWFVSVTDIDDLKRAEIEAKTAEEDLNRVRSELSHVARVTMLNALTASIAHEVNQPLFGILTNASTCLRMLDGDPPNIDGARETARRTMRDANRASDVIVRLRALFSKKEFTPESLDLNDATREVIALSLSDLQRNRVTLQAELADDLPNVKGDRVELQQVVLNLLRNASDAMSDVHDRPRLVVVKTERETGDRVRLAVRDAGVGIDGQNVAKLFDPFYTTKSGGMGIGLAISRSIIESHHGRLWATPNDGGDPGATFGFSVPALTSPV